MRVWEALSEISFYLIRIIFLRNILWFQFILLINSFFLYITSNLPLQVRERSTDPVCSPSLIMEHDLISPKKYENMEICWKIIQKYTSYNSNAIEYGVEIQKEIVRRRLQL